MMKYFLLLPFLLINTLAIAQSSSPAVRYSELLLFAIRDKQPVDVLLQELWQYKQEDLLQEMTEDKFKKAFWINIYNAFVLLELPGKASSKLVPGSFFKEKIVRVAGKKIALSTIEKKMLGTGAQGLQQWDYRILFALSKGAFSSPDIIVYDSENVEQLLNIASRNYLKREVHMDEEGLEAEVPEIFRKRRKDFGGRDKVIEILRTNEVIYMNVLPKLEYRSFNWAIRPATFLPGEMLRQ
jgi:Protein of unknown function, DUF547